MQIAKLNYRWEVNENNQVSWGYKIWKDLYCDNTETNVCIRQEDPTSSIYVCGGSVPEQGFKDIRDAEEYAEKHFKDYLNRFLVTATPAYDITAFARF